MIDLYLVFIGTLIFGFIFYAITMIYFINLNHSEIKERIEQLNATVERLEFLKVEYKAYMKPKKAK